jgi:predicted MFS family arabinose efflux permease
MGVALGVFGMSREIVLALLASVALGVLANLPEPLYWSTYAERVDEGSSGPFYGLVESLIISAFAVGGALSGAFLSWFGVSTAAWVLGLAAAAATGALLPTARRWQNRQAPRSGQVATEDRATT